MNAPCKTSGPFQDRDAANAVASNDKLQWNQNSYFKILTYILDKA